MASVQTVVVQTYDLFPIVENKKIVHFLEESVEEVKERFSKLPPVLTDDLCGRATYKIYSLEEYLDQNKTTLFRVLQFPGIRLDSTYRHI